MSIFDVDRLPDEWRESGRFVLFGEGEPCAYVNWSGVCLGPHLHTDPCVNGRYPPAAFVEAAQAGRHPVTVPCPKCDGRRTIQTYDGDLGHLTQPCPDCQTDPLQYEWSGASGRITVAHATVEWGPLPVVDHSDSRADHVVIDPCVVVRRRELRLWDGHRWSALTLPPGVDPASLIGQYALGGTIGVLP